jgi:precorrin-4 methylase
MLEHPKALSTIQLKIESENLKDTAYFFVQKLATMGNQQETKLYIQCKSRILRDYTLDTLFY